MTVDVGRLARLRSILDERELDAFIITTKSNIRYVSGFTGSNGRIVVTDEDVTLVTDSRYTERAQEELATAQDVVGTAVGVETSPGAGHGVVEELLDGRVSIGLEADDQSWSQVTACLLYTSDAADE